MNQNGRSKAVNNNFGHFLERLKHAKLKEMIMFYIFQIGI